LPQPCKRLPPAYQRRGTLDLSQNRKLLIALNLVGLVAFILFGLLFLKFAAWLRPEATVTLTLAGVLVVLLGSVLVILLHEALHGFGFWLFTRERPTRRKLLCLAGQSSRSRAAAEPASVAVSAAPDAMIWRP